MWKRSLTILVCFALLFNITLVNIYSGASAATSSVSVATDKNDAEIGDIITTQVLVTNIDKLVAMQVNIKYDSTVLQAVLGNGIPYANSTSPEGGTILSDVAYSPDKKVENNISAGIINFSKYYSSVPNYKESGAYVGTGVLGIIKFKVLQKKYTQVVFEDAIRLTQQGGANGVLMVNWDGQVINSGYTVTGAVIDFGQSPPVSPTPTSTPTPTPTPTPTSTPIPTPTPTSKPSSGGGGGGVRATPTPTPTPTPTSGPVVDVKIPYTDGSNNVSGELTREIILKSRDNNVIYINVGTGLADIRIDPNFIDVDGNLSKVLLDIIKSPTDGTTTIKGTIVNKDGTKSNIDYELNKPLHVNLPYILGPNETKDNITIFLITDDGNMVNLRGKYDEATGKIDFYTDQFGKFIIKPNNVSFSDVKDDYWGKKYIEAMAAKGIFSGREFDMFYPEEGVTRAEFTKLITMVLGLVDYKAVNIFSDIRPEHWYGLYIASAYKHGIVNGRPDGTFGPNDTITRQDMAAMTARALKGNLTEFSKEDLNFKDNNAISDYAVSSLAYTVKSGIILGRPGEIMDPKGTTNRAEAAVIIYRIFNSN